MNKLKLSILLTGSVLVSVAAAGKYVPLSSNIENNNLKPTISVVKEDSKECVVEVSIPGFFKEEKVIEGKSYTEIELSDDAVLNKYGDPALPFVSGILSLPINTTLSVESIKKGTSTIFDNIVVMPAQNQAEHNNNKSFIINQDAYNSASVYPRNIVEIDSVKIRNGSNEYVRIAVNPFEYISSDKKLTVYNSLTVTLRKTSTGLGKTLSQSNSRLDKIFQNITINNLSEAKGLQKAASSVSNDKKVLLIIVPNAEYKTIVDEYAKWKHMSGVYTTVVTTEQTGRTLAEIKEYIKKAYEDARHPLTDVILVGKLTDITSKSFVFYTYDYYSDNNYGCITGNDYIPEVFVARIPVTNPTVLKVIMKKLLMYEKLPYMDNTEWYKKAVMCSNDAFESQAETKRTVAAILRDSAGFSVDTLMMKRSGVSPSKSTVISSISSGCAILNYRGEGWSDGWSAYSEFHIGDLGRINNTNMFTFVTSIGCGVASWFDADIGDGFGEVFLSLGTEEKPRGAITFVGPVSNTNTAYNNNIDRGLYKGLIYEGLETPSDALLRGLSEMYKVFGSTDELVEMHYREYTVLGDPTLRLYKGIPQKVTIEKPKNLPIGQTQCVIRVKNGDNGINGVTVCGTTKSGVHVVGKTRDNGSAILDLYTNNEEILTIVVKGNSVYPVIDSIQVIKKEIHCAPDTGFKVIDTDGNNDGKLNPKEQAKLEFTIKNYGTKSATGIKVSLTSPNSLITLSNNLDISVADIEANGNGQKVSFPCNIAEQVSAGTIVLLKMEIKTGAEINTFTIIATIHACDLKYSSLKVIETGTNTGLPNRLDPGENANLIIKLTNTGKDKAMNVTGKLTSSDQYIKITDGSGVFGTIPTEGSAENIGDYFTVEIGSSCPADYTIDAILELTTSGGNYPYSSKIPIKIPVAVPTENDPTGPDSYGYSIISSKDLQYKNSPKYNWNDISQKGTEVPINYDMSSARKVVDLPFLFKFYGTSYSSCVIHINGMISFDVNSNISKYNVKIAPETDGFKSFISVLGISPEMLFVTDLIDTIKSKIYYYNDTQNKQFIIQYENVNNRGKSQIVLRDPSLNPTPTGDGEILLIYYGIRISESQQWESLIGIENETEKVGLAYYYKKKYDKTANSIISNSALLVTTAKPELGDILSVDKKNNSFTPGLSLRINEIYPNPFVSNAVFEYSLPKAGNVSIHIYNASGRVIKKINNRSEQAGRHFTVWDGTDISGKCIGTGMYIVQVNFEGIVSTRQIFKIGK